ncbi:MAG: head GIN domain-containing protein [Chitinophagaceae bacterium]
MFKRSILYVLVSLFIFLCSCNKDMIKGSGSVSTRSLTVAPFSKVESHYDISANISYGATQQISVSGYNNLLDILDVKVENGILKLKYNTTYNSVRNGNIVADIKIPTIEKASIHGSGNLSINNFTNASNIETLIHGSGNILVNNSKFQTAKLSIHGSGKIEARELEANLAEANIYGSGNINITVSNHLKASIYGSGSIYYWGNASVETNQQGSGRIIKQ